MALGLGDFIVKVNADTTNFKAGMRDMSSEIKGREAEVRQFSQNMAKALGAIGLAITGLGMASAKHFAAVGDELDKMAKRTGMSVELLSRLRFAAERSGTSIQGVEVGVRRLQKAMSDANRGMATYTQAFDRLGLSYEELMRLTPDEQFRAVMDALAGVADASTRAALAQDLLGRAGTQLLPMIADGTAEFERLMRVADELGVTMDKEAAAKAAALRDAITDLKASTQGLTWEIGAALTPTIKGVADKMTETVAGVGRWADANPVLAATISQTGMAMGGLLTAVGGYVLIKPKVVAAAKAIGLAMHMKLGPLGLVTGAVAALTMGLLYLGNRGREANEELRRLAQEGLEENLDRLNELRRQMEAHYDDEIQALREHYGVWVGEGQMAANSLMDQQEELYAKRKRLLEKERTDFLRLWNFMVDKNDESYRQAMRQIDDELAAFVRMQQEKMRALDDLDRGEERTRLERRKAQLEEMLRVVESDEKRIELVEELDAVSRDLTRWRRRQERLDIQDSISEAQRESDAKRELITEEYEHARHEINQTVMAFIEGTEQERAEIMKTWTVATEGMVDYADEWDRYHRERMADLDEWHETQMKNIALERQAEEEKHRDILRDTLERFAITEALNRAALKDMEEGTDTLSKLIAELSPELQLELSFEIEEAKAALEKWEEERPPELLLPTGWERMQYAARGLIDMTSDMIEGIGKGLSWLWPWSKEHGGSGTATQPTLFLAGEAGPEQYAFFPQHRDPLDVLKETPDLYQRITQAIEEEKMISPVAMAQGGSGVAREPTLFLAGEGGTEHWAFFPEGRDPLDVLKETPELFQKVMAEAGRDIPEPFEKVLAQATLSQEVVAKAEEHEAPELFQKAGVLDRSTEMFRQIEELPLIPMARGGRGKVWEPTLFLAGEAGPEPFAFGEQAVPEPLGGAISPQMPNQVVGTLHQAVHIHDGIFLGDRESAYRLAQFLMPEIRRQQRMGTGEVEW